MNTKKKKKMRNRVTSMVREAKRTYFQKLVNEDRSTSTLWKAINALTRGPKRNPNDFIPPNITAEILNKHFLTVASKLIEENDTSKKRENYTCSDYSRTRL